MEQEKWHTDSGSGTTIEVLGYHEKNMSLFITQRNYLRMFIPEFLKCKSVRQK